MIVRPQVGNGIPSGTAGLLSLTALPYSLRGGAVGNTGDYVLPVPGDVTAEQYAAELEATGGVVYASPNYVMYPTNYTATPNDPAFTDGVTWYSGVNGTYENGKSWYLHGPLSAHFDTVWPHLANDGSTVAYDARTGPNTIKVAIIDTGFYMDHPDKGNAVVGKDCFATYDGRTGITTTDDDVTPCDPSAPWNDVITASHGTETASEVSAATNNATGMAGASYDTQVVVYKVMGIWTAGYLEAGVPAGAAFISSSAVIDAIHRATDNGCKVISMSLGGSDAGFQEAVDYAHSHGVLVVASTGNTHGSGVLYPAACDHVDGVGSYSLVGSTATTRSPFSTYGPGTDILAPGVCIYGTAKPDQVMYTGTPAGYSWWQGTSMAAPLVAAAAADIWRLMPDLGPDEVSACLTSTAASVAGSSGWNAESGWGRLDAGAAMSKLASDYANLGQPKVQDIYSGAYLNTRTVAVSWLPVSGYQLTYGVSKDGAATATSTATTLSMTGLTDRVHAVTITPASPRNWSAGSALAVTFTVDTLAPHTADDATSWTGPRGVSLVASDAVSGVAATMWALDGSVAVTYTAPVAVPAGTHTLTYRSVDNAGNWEATETVTVRADGTPPATTDNAPVAGWQRSAVSVTLTPSDALSGVAATFYRLNGGPATPYAGPVRVAGEGVSTLAYWSVDNGGNTETTETATVRIDTLAPHTAATAPAGWQKVATSFTLAATDTGSGVAGTYYTLDGGATTPYTGRVAVSKPGTTTVVYWSVDDAGNTETTETATVRIDATPPTTTDDAPAGWQKAATVTLTVADALSGVAGTSYRLDGGPVLAYTGPLAISKAGTTTLTYWSVDNAGNPEVPHTATVLLAPTPPPVPSVSWDAGSGQVSWTDTVTVPHATQLALDDQASAVPVSGLAWTPPVGTVYGTHTAWVRMSDAAGNVGGWGFASFTLIDPASIHASVLSFTSAPTLTVGWGAAAVFSGILAGSDGPTIGGVGVALECSLDSGVSWTQLTTATAAADGTWRASWAPGRNALVRARFAGDATHTAGVSVTTVSLSQRVYLSTPRTPSKVIHKHKFVTYAYLKPSFTSGTHPVTLRFYRSEKHRGKHSWTLRKTVTMKAANYSSYTRMSVSASVPYAGKWRAVATYAGSSTWAATTSGARSFTAK